MRSASTADPREAPSVATRGGTASAPRGKATSKSQRNSARVRAAALGRLLLAIAPTKGSAITLSVTTKRGIRTRSTFSHPSVLIVLRRAIADAQASAAAQANGQPRAPLSQSTSPPAQVAASA